MLLLSVRSVVYSEYIRTREEEIAWAAGLFEGEGTITISNERLVVRLVNTDEAIVRRLAEIVPFGTIYGPYDRQERDGFHRKSMDCSSRKRARCPCAEVAVAQRPAKKTSSRAHRHLISRVFSGG
jgi:hypothetical protein